MFRKNSSGSLTRVSGNKKEALPSIVAKDVNILGNIISDGNIDFDGTLNGNIRCAVLTIRGNGHVKGEVVANDVLVYGVVRGLIRAKNVQLFANCNVEGIIMHETIAIEDGAIVDGKFKRTNKVQTSDDENTDTDFVFEDGSASTESGILDNIRLIR